jgi:two-component system, OmpR family, sensor kinase
MGLRARLTLLVTATLAVALVAVFLVTYSGTGDQVLEQIDQDLRQDATTLDLQGIPFDLERRSEVEAAVRDYVDAQPSFGGSARLYVVRLSGGPVVTNEPELLGLARPLAERPNRRVRAQRAADARRLLAAPAGYSTHKTQAAGTIRLYSSPLERSGRRVARVSIGEPLGAVARARAGVAQTFLLAGAVALGLAALAGFLIASGTSRPLRRMARTAAAVDAGALSVRIRERRRRDEVRVLADAFDRMLDRLEDAFARQRGFVSDASHELRTPLTVIRGQLEVLSRQDEVTVDDVRRVHALVQPELVRMERLVADLLLLARADEGQLVRLEPVGVDGLVTEAWEPLTATADRAFGLGSLPGGTVRADADRVAQVVANLVRNAIEHTAPGGVVRLTARGADGVLEVAVEDDGPGIPPEHREGIFDRFHRTDAGRARSAGGAGLGLAIARAIVAAHDGTIAADASPEGGARVAFTLPGWAPDEPAAPPPSVVGHPAALGSDR